MTQKEFKEFATLKEKLDKEVGDLFSYIKEKYIDCLAFGKWSCIDRYDFDDESITITYYDYGYDLYDSRDIEILLDDFFNDPVKWADKWADGIHETKRKKNEREKEYKEKKEREELQRLKEKYESN